MYNAGYKTSTSSDTFYKKIAYEKRKIESHMVLFDFIDPYFYKYLSVLPNSFLGIGKLFFNTNEPPLSFDDPNLSQ